MNRIEFGLQLFLLKEFFNFQIFPIKTLSFKHIPDFSKKHKSIELFNKILYYNDNSEKKKTGLIEIVKYNP